MLRLIRGEFYRVLHKKSTYVYFGFLGVAYFLLAFIRSGGFNEETIIKDALTFSSFLPALVGGFLFAAIYTDDLISGSLTTLVGFGTRKATIVGAKALVMTGFSAIVFALVPVAFYAAHAVAGWPASASTMATLYAIATKYLLATIAYAVLTGIAVYGLQRATFAMVTFILLAFNMVGGLVTVFLANILGAELATPITDRLISGLTDRIFLGLVGSGSLAAPIIEYLAYLTIAAALSVIVFRKKEMEF